MARITRRFARIFYPLRLHFSLGRRGERYAAKYMERQFYVIWHRNWRGTRGEIDLVALRDRCVVFVEVKTRSGRGSHLTPFDQITPLKIRRMKRAAQSFLESRRLDLRRRGVRDWRIDIVGVVGDAPGRRFVAIEHIEDAVQNRHTD